MKKIYFIGIGGIGVSALARYYKSIGWDVYGSDLSDSDIIKGLKKEDIKITIGENSKIIDESFSKVIYSEAVNENQIELKKAKEIKIETKNYPEGLAEIANSNKLIAIAGTHGKSTTTTLASVVFKNSDENFTSIVGTLVKEFDNKNFFTRFNKNKEDKYFLIEACEYKRSFLNYKPSVVVITNIELDHLDYYKNLEDYISAYEDLISNTIKGGFCILNGEDENSKKLIGKNVDINYIVVYNDYYIFNDNKVFFSEFEMQVPGNHILFDAKLAYILGQMAGINELSIINSLEDYSGVWRRMEIVGETKNKNLIISDYGHHPTEIKLTLKAIKDKYNTKKIVTIFQPHQYNRTIELIEDFKNCFIDTHYLIITDIYESRDNENDKINMSREIFIEKINHKNKINGLGFKNTVKILEEIENENKNNELVIILMGAGNIDNLRYEIKKD